jgi:hypothetical protein
LSKVIHENGSNLFVLESGEHRYARNSATGSVLLNYAFHHFTSPLSGSMNGAGFI